LEIPIGAGWNVIGWKWLVRLHSLATWEVPMEYVVPILLITVTFFAVTARAWQKKHTYLDEFWHSNGW
jgi:hypothetical protein